MDLHIFWFVLLGVLMAGYGILDGFDLGVGILHPLARTDEERRIFMNSIGPLWDGNEVWLVTAGGALFAAFPDVYATVFSGFYLGFMLFVVALIFRAVAIEFRSKQASAAWRAFWDVSFSLASIFIAFLIGLVMGNIVWGVPIGPDKNFQGTFLSLFHPYSILTGVVTLSLFMMHGAIYIVMKTEGELRERASGWVRNGIIFFILCYAAITMATLLYVPHMTETIKRNPWLFSVGFLNVLAIANVPREIHKGRDFLAFLSSCAAVVALMALFGLGMFPDMVYSSPGPEHSLTIYNAASSQKTLGIMLIIAMLGIPLVLAYTVCIYWIFRGKVKLDSASY
jgi:cytochrome d ubiquinol oxidase subunit II